MTEVGDAALELARLGFHIFPTHTIRSERCTCRDIKCTSKGKHPRFKEEFLENGCKAASTGSGRVEAFWREWPSANVGLATGHGGLIVLDVDPRHGGDETLYDHITRSGDLPATVRVITGGGGSHYYLRGPEGLTIRNNAQTKLGPGLDVRGVGGYVIAPPSLHESGKRYEWEVGYEPWSVTIADCPQWLLDLIKDDEEQHKNFAQPVGVMIPEGQRDSTLASLGGSMRRRGMTYDAILAALLAENDLKCSPPLPRGDVQRIAMSVARYAPHLTVVPPQVDPTVDVAPPPDPALDVIAENHIRVYVWADFGVVEFDCDEIEEGGKRELDTLLTVKVDGVGITREPYVQPINLRSQSSRSALQTALNYQFGKREWTTLISTAYNRLIPAYTEAQEAIAEETAGSLERTPPVFMLRPFVVQRAGTILFALPGKGKTYTALLWAVSIDAGVSKLWPVRQGKVLYINLERDEPSMARRLGAINEALGLPRDRKLLMIHRKGKSLVQVVKAIGRIIEEKRVDVVFLDAISRAGAGSMVADDVANRIADQLNGFGCTWVALGHTAWPANGVSNGDSHIYGSVMFEAAADLCVALASEEDASNGTLGIGLQVTKGNDVGKTSQERLAYSFDETGLIGVRRATEYEFSEVRQNAKVRTPALTLVKEYLFSHGASDAETIADAIGRSRNTVVEVLQGPGFMSMGMLGKKKLYGVQVSETPVGSFSENVSAIGNGEVSEATSLRNRQIDTSTVGSVGRPVGGSVGPEYPTDEPDSDDPSDACVVCGSLKLSGYDDEFKPRCVAHYEGLTGRAS